MNTMRGYLILLWKRKGATTNVLTEIIAASKDAKATGELPEFMSVDAVRLINKNPSLWLAGLGGE